MGARPTALILVVLLLGGCSPSKAPESATVAARSEAAVASDAKAGGAKPGGAKPEPEDASTEKKEPSGDVSLSTAEVENLQIVVTSLHAVSYLPNSAGLGTVLGHEAVAQAAADLDTAAAAVKQSGDALARAKRLAGGPGALGLDAVEVAARQVSVDEASLVLARRKLSATLGLHFPWHGSAAARIVEQLASGSAKLARVTFPPGELRNAPPKDVTVNLLNGTASSATWLSRDLWQAPEDPAVPGQSYFALFKTADMPEGARLQAVAGGEGGQKGVLVPFSAVVMSNSQPWVYVRKGEGIFSRVQIDIGRPLAEGYFVPEILAAGDAVVTSGAGLLLARQMNASSAGADR
jgi:hypothetical protein